MFQRGSKLLQHQAKEKILLGIWFILIYFYFS